MGIAEHIKHIAKQSAGDGMQLCIVKSVDEAKSMCECEPVNGGAPYFARLRALIEVKDKSPLIVPVKDSVVIVATFSKNSAEAFVLGYTEVEKIKLLTSKGEVWLNGDNNGGLVMLKELKENLDSLKSFVEGMHSALPSAFNAIVPTAPAPFVATGALGATTYQVSMAGKIINLKDMENKKVKHGDK